MLPFEARQEKRHQSEPPMCNTYVAEIWFIEYDSCYLYLPFLGKSLQPSTIRDHACVYDLQDESLCPYEDRDRDRHKGRATSFEDPRQDRKDTFASSCSYCGGKQPKYPHHCLELECRLPTALLWNPDSPPLAR